MKNTIYLFLLFAFSSSFGQKIRFEYDNAGNQILRRYCSNCPNKNTNPKEIAKLQPEDMQKFFPEDVISYYPNPVKDELFLKWELINNNKVSKIEMYSLSGQLMKSFSDTVDKENQIVNFQEYPQGIYFVKLVYSNGDEKSIKIIKQ